MTAVEPDADDAHWSTQARYSAVLRLLRGEELKELARELQIPARLLTGWREEFLAAGMDRLGGDEGAESRSDPGEQRTRKGQATEVAFREAARRVFIRDGYFNAKINDIAAEAGKSAGSFYNYFDSKEDLLAALAIDFYDQARELLERRSTKPGSVPSDPRGHIEEHIKAYWATFRDRKAEICGVFEAGMSLPEFVERWRQIRALAIQQIADDYIRPAQRAGGAPGLDPLLGASALLALNEQFAYVWLSRGGDAVDLEFNDEVAVRTLTEIWYHALYGQVASAPAPRRARPAPKRARST